MAFMTIHRRLALFHLLRVAAVAGALPVGTTKWEPGFLGVIEFRSIPGRRRMACAALLAEAPCVDIIARMAARAGFRKLSFAGWQAMTCGAASFAVCANQREATFPLVIETLLAPGIGLVTISAIQAEVPFVCVVDGMTRHAIRWRFFVVGRDMASIAACSHMSTRQRIFGRIMIEPGLAPIQLIVALTTVVRERASVSIIILVAIPTLARSLAPRRFGRVASCARHDHMTTL
jgi:hypothetical protein